MTGILNFLSQIVNLISIVIDCLVRFFNLCVDGVTFILSLGGYIPSFLLPFLGAFVLILVVKLLAGR